MRICESLIFILRIINHFSFSFSRNQNPLLITTVPPRVRAKPEDGNIVVKKGTEVTLECSASGNPVPTVTWTRDVSIAYYI